MEIDQRQMDELTPAQLGTLVARIQSYVTEHGPRIGFTLLLFDRQGLRTLGNMAPEMQLEAATLIVERMGPGGEGADAAFEIECGQPAVPPEKH